MAAIAAGIIASAGQPEDNRVRAGAARSAAARLLLLDVRPADGGGGIDRPITPATAISVSTYGSVLEEHGRGLASTRAGSASAAREAEQDAAKPRRRTAPVPEDERGEGDEPAARGHVLVERADEADRQVRAAERAASTPRAMTAA